MKLHFVFIGCKKGVKVAAAKMAKEKDEKASEKDGDDEKEENNEKEFDTKK